MNFRAFSVVSVLLTAAFLSAGPLSAEGIELAQSYTYDPVGVTADYPVGWTIQQQSERSVTFVSPLTSHADDFNEYVNVLYEDISQIPDFSLERYRVASLQTAPNLIPEFKLVGSGPATVASHEAYWLEYSGKQTTGPVRFRAYSFMIGKRIYTVTFGARPFAYDDFLPIAEKIISTLRIAESLPDPQAGVAS